jgi:CAAX prenyl protease-like protein
MPPNNRVKLAARWWLLRLAAARRSRVLGGPKGAASGRSCASWIRRLREPSLVLGAILAAAWLAPLVSGWILMLQSVLGAGALLVIIRSAMRDGVAPSELGLRVDNLFVSSLFLLITIVPLAAVHLLVGKPGFRWSRVPTYLVWAFFQQLLIVAGAWRHFLQPTLSLMTWRSGLGAAVVAAGFFALAHAPNVPLMGLVFGAELVWLIAFIRLRNVFALALVHSLAANVVRHDLVPGYLSSLKVGIRYWSP